MRKIFRKNNISNSLIRTHTCAYQGVRNISFSKNFPYMLNGRPLVILWWSHRLCQHLTKTICQPNSRQFSDLIFKPYDIEILFTLKCCKSSSFIKDTILVNSIFDKRWRFTTFQNGQLSGLYFTRWSVNYEKCLFIGIYKWYSLQFGLKVALKKSNWLQLFWIDHKQKAFNKTVCKIQTRWSVQNFANLNLLSRSYSGENFNSNTFRS